MNKLKTSPRVSPTNPSTRDPSLPFKINQQEYPDILPKVDTNLNRYIISKPTD